MTHRVEASQRRTDTRQWVTERRERTRHLIELGGLVQKAGLVELADDDRVVLLGGFLRMAELLCDNDAQEKKALWRRYGIRVFIDGADSRCGI